MKSAKDFLTEANAVVPRISGVEALGHYGKDDAVFIDVRDSKDIANSGTIKGALRIPRGFIEFAADDTMPYHHKELSRDKSIYLVCAAGGQAALAGKTLLDMGYSKVTNIGGISEWKEAGGAMDDA